MIWNGHKEASVAALHFTVALTCVSTSLGLAQSYPVEAKFGSEIIALQIILSNAQCLLLGK